VGLFERSLIAVDIGSSSIKMVELGGKPSSRKLKNYGVEMLPEGAVEDGVIVNADVVQSAMRKLTSQMGVKGRRTSISLSGSGVLVRKVSVSVGKDAILAEQIPFHAEQAFQLDPMGLYYDYVELPTREVKNDVSDVLLVGARREVVEQFIQCIKDSGLKLGVIESDALSLANAFEQNYGSVAGLVALVNVGATHTQISFIYDGVFLYSRDIPLGGATYTKRVMEALNLSFENAESLKLSATLQGHQQSSQIFAVLQDINDQIVHELSGTLNYFLRQQDIPGESALKFIFLTGGASRTPGLDAAIAGALQAPVAPLNPFQRVAFNDRVFQLDQMALVSPMLGVAAGLGLRDFQDKEAS
jgi:type IV pilus assembly protein PilM